MRVFLPLIAAVALVGCGGNEAATVTEVAVLGDPIDCLVMADLSDVEYRGRGTWRGFHEGPPFYGVLVDRFESRKKARALFEDATAVYRAQAGIYVVTGPATVAAGGLLEGDEGLEANRLVHDIASCLGG